LMCHSWSSQLPSWPLAQTQAWVGKGTSQQTMTFAESANHSKKSKHITKVY